MNGNLSPHQFTNVPAEHLPVEDDDYKHTPGSFAVAYDDAPSNYLQGANRAKWEDHLGGTYSLQHVPVHDVAPPDTADWDEADHSQVQDITRLLKDNPEAHTTALLGPSPAQRFGGNHRTAAYIAAGRETIPMWLRDRGER